MPILGGIPRLVNSAGVSVAMYMLLTAEPISADLAFKWGLVAAVVPHDEFMSHEGIAGATRFVSGLGRHGDFSKI